jgi:hypothetical protein
VRGVAKSKRVTGHVAQSEAVYTMATFYIDLSFLTDEVMAELQDIVPEHLYDMNHRVRMRSVSVVEGEGETTTEISDNKRTRYAEHENEPYLPSKSVCVTPSSSVASLFSLASADRDLPAGTDVEELQAMDPSTLERQQCIQEWQESRKMLLDIDSPMIGPSSDQFPVYSILEEIMRRSRSFVVQEALAMGQEAIRQHS